MAPRPELVLPNGQPATSLIKAGDPLGELVELVKPPIVDNGDSVTISKDVLTRMAQERARRIAVTSVPSTPRHLMREAGSTAVGKGYGRWPHITMDMLRDIRERAPILAPIHQARQYQVRRMAVPWPGQKGKVGIRVVHKDHFEHDAVPPSGFERYIKQFEAVLWKPAPDYDFRTLGSALTCLMEDLLTINRPAVEPIYSAVDNRRIVQWRPIDGAIIWPTLLFVEKWLADNPTWRFGYDSSRMVFDGEKLLDLVSAKVDMDLHAAEYVLVREGIAEAVYPKGRLLIAPIRNRTDIRYAGYPPSHVEQAMALIAAFINTFDYNASLFTKGMMAEFILGLPANMHDEDVDAFIDMFREATQGVRRAHQPPIIPLPNGSSDNAIQKIDLKPTPEEMMFESFMSLQLSLTTGVYRMHTSTIGAKPWDGGAGASLNEGNKTEEIALAKEEGLQGDLGHLIDEILNPLAERCHPDLRVIAEYGDYDPMKEAQVYELRSKVDMTRNEIRIEQGAHPRGFYLNDEEYETASDIEREKHDQNVWNMPCDPVFASTLQQQQQAEQAKQMMAMQGQQQPGQMPQGEGHDDGYGGKDDGFGGTHESWDPSPYGSPQGAPKPPSPSPAMPKPKPTPAAPAAPAGVPMAKAVKRVTITLPDRS